MSYFLPSTDFLGFSLLIFLFLNIQSCLPIPHFNWGFIFFFHLYLTLFVISIIPLLPFLISNHLTKHDCHHLLNILLFSFTSFFTAIILLFVTFSNSLCCLLLVFLQDLHFFNFLMSYYLFLALCISLYLDILCQWSKVKESHNRPSVAQRVPGGLGSQISMTFGTWMWWGCHPHALAAFTLRKCSWYSFSPGAESTPGPRYGRKEYVTEKSIDTTGNQSRDCPTSNAAP
jgi:hypothetical protein